MPFDAPEPRVSAGDPEKLVSIRLKNAGESGRPRAILAVRKGVAENLTRWSATAKVQVQFGTGEDAGKMRVVLMMARPDGACTVMGRKQRTFLVDLGFIARFPHEDRAKVNCVARAVDTETLEVDLPDWNKVPPPLLVGEEADEDDEPEETKFSTGILRGGKRPLPAQKSAPVRSTATDAMSDVVTKDGITVVCNPPELIYRAGRVGLTYRQARMLGVLTRALNATVPTQEIVDRMKCSGASADTIRDDHAKVQAALLGVGLRLTQMPKFGYCLSIGAR